MRKTKQLTACFLATCFLLSGTVSAEETNITQETDITQETNITNEIEIGSGTIDFSTDSDIKKWRHKETMIRERVHKEIGDAWLSTDQEIYYICYDGLTDYVLTEYNGNVYAFYVRVTPDGEYFLSPIQLNDSTEGKFRAMMTADHLHTDRTFWEKVSVKDPDKNINISIRPIDENGVMQVPYFNQGRGFYLGNGEWACEDWPQVQFEINGHTMHEAGCGFFSTAMALSYLKQEIIAPINFKENGQYTGNGSAVTVGVATAESYGVYAYFTSDINEVIEALRNGHPVMEHVGESIFTNGGHYILLIGYTKDGLFAVADPGHVDNSYFYNGSLFDQDTILNAARYIDTAFTIFE